MSTSTFARWSCVLILSACLMPATAMGAYIRDQYEPDSDWGNTANADVNYVTQTFTTTYGTSESLPGALAYIRVDLYQAGTDVVADLYRTVSGNPNPEDKIATSDPGEIVSGWENRFSFITDDFPNGVSLDEDVMYAFALRSDSGVNVGYRYTMDKYGGGIMGTLTSDGDWYGASGYDLAFETWHTPEPSAMVGLLSMGSLALVYSGLRRRARKRAAR